MLNSVSIIPSLDDELTSSGQAMGWLATASMDGTQGAQKHRANLPNEGE